MVASNEYWFCGTPVAHSGGKSESSGIVPINPLIGSDSVPVAMV